MGTELTNSAALKTRPCRRGSSIVEMIAAGVLLGVIFVTMVPVLSWAGAQRQSAEQRQWALQEVANLMERVSLQPWESLSEKTLSQLPLSEECRKRLRDANLAIRVVEEDPVPASKRVVLELRWKDRTGQTVSPIRLTAWFCRHEEASE